MCRSTESVSQTMYRLNPTKERDEGVRERLTVYIPSRQVNDRHVLMLIPTLHWYCFNKYELHQTSSLQTSRNQMAAHFNRFFSECVRCGNTFLRSCFWLEIPLCPTSRGVPWVFAACATCSCCYSRVLLRQRCELGVRVLCRDPRPWCGCAAGRKGLYSCSSSLWP